MLQGQTDLLAWVSVAAFLLAAVAQWWDRDRARLAAAGAWGVFAVFWLALVPFYAFEMKSIIEAALAAAAVPGSLYAGYLLYRGRESLLVLTRSVAVMGAIYLPFTTVPWLYGPLVETTTRQIEWGIYQLGYTPGVTTGELGLRNTFVFETDGHTYLQSIVLACTGIGSLTIFIGLVAAVRASLGRKLRALAIALPIIWVLNVFRNVFIAVAQGKQWFAGIAEQVIFTLFATSDPRMVSFFWADRVISQSLSVVALVVLFYLVTREVPELSTVFEDVLFMATGREYDLQQELGLGVRTDGGPERE
jgi:archaeosortase A (PGF-CTERM-specific)